MTTKLIPTLAEAQNRLHESIKNKMDERVVKVINDSIDASIDYGTNVVEFSLFDSVDADLVVNYLKIFKYDSVVDASVVPDIAGKIPFPSSDAWYAPA
jgi:hypothetical protein